MNIVCSIDNNYVQHCCVMLASFFENNHSEQHTIYLLTESLEQDSFDIIKNLIYSYQGLFYSYQIDSDALKSCPIRETDHLTIATYYRLLIADVLPPTVEKVLYLDCDIVVNKSIEELWNTDLRNYALAAVEELGCSPVDSYERLGYDRKYGYFNAGVLLINLDFWRKNDMTQVFFSYIAENFMKLKAHDQDVLNALLHDKCLLLSYKWNVEEGFYHYYMIKKMRHERVFSYILRNPAILHYSWKPKPWDLGCKHPFRVNYYCYLDKAIRHGLPRTSISVKGKVCFFMDKAAFCILLWLRVSGNRFYNLK